MDSLRRQANNEKQITANQLTKQKQKPETTKSWPWFTHGRGGYKTMITANVFFLGYIYGSGGVPMNRKMEIDHRPIYRTNADAGWADDLIVKQLTEQLTKKLGFKVVLQSIVVIKESEHGGGESAQKTAQTDTDNLQDREEGQETKGPSTQEI